MARSITEKIDPTRIYRPAQETTNLSGTTTCCTYVASEIPTPNKGK